MVYKACDLYSGGEGIEPPPKVLETPIIPVDQPPRKYFSSCTLHINELYLQNFIQLISNQTYLLPKL